VDDGGRPCAALPADERLTWLARDRLSAQGLASRHVDVTTVDGAVYLRGRTRAPAEAETIASVIEGIPGVQRVVNELKAPEETT
jgi:osmotically-inducible protein OsmY